MTPQGDRSPVPGGAESAQFEAGYRAGLEQAAASAYETGYADAEVTLKRVIAGFLQAYPPAEVIRDLEATRAREAAAARPLDPRTGAQLQRDAYLSWGLRPPARVARQAAADDTRTTHSTATHEAIDQDDTAWTA